MFINNRISVFISISLSPNARYISQRGLKLYSSNFRFTIIAIRQILSSHERWMYHAKTFPLIFTQGCLKESIVKLVNRIVFVVIDNHLSTLNSLYIP